MNFRIYEYLNNPNLNNIYFYFIEGTAPDNVEDGINKDDLCPKGMERKENIDRVIQDISEKLTNSAKSGSISNLVFMVHGFNNPRKNAIEFFRKAASFILENKVVSQTNSNDVTICVGYRWPSEEMFRSVLCSSLSALPIFSRALLYTSLAIITLKIASLVPKSFSDSFLSWINSIYHISYSETPAIFLSIIDLLKYIMIIASTKIIFIPSIALFSIIAVLTLLRAIVYFRDNYRAINYGAPDLVEIIRQIDFEANKYIRDEKKDIERIHLSFIGHSMGGLVVTNAIRTLSDVCDQDKITRTLSGNSRTDKKNKLSKLDLMLTNKQKQILLDQEKTGDDNEDKNIEIREPEEKPADLRYETGPIGHVFTLKRLLLISPDIPVESLLSERANFLAPSLKRFREAYLFSNEGDEVLRMISPVVNYFLYPTKDCNFGYRLGNAEILSSYYPRAMPENSDELFNLIRVGRNKLINYCDNLDRKKNNRLYEALDIAKVFTYIDCTDYIDEPKNRAYLTHAPGRKEKNPEDSLKWYEHIMLLIYYNLNKVNVHGGYFEGKEIQIFIFRLACLGWEKTLEAYGVDKLLNKQSGFNLTQAADILDRSTNSYEMQRLGLKYLSDLCTQHHVRALLSQHLSQHRERLNAMIKSSQHESSAPQDPNASHNSDESDEASHGKLNVEEGPDGWLVIGEAR